MGQAHFTNGTLDDLEKDDWVDDRYPNLIFRVGARTRTWLYRQPRLADGSRPGLKLGRYPDLALDDAVTKYIIERGRIAKGEPHPDLEQRIRELEAELRALKRSAGNFVTFGDLAKRFLADYVPKGGRALTPAVRKRYRQMLELRPLPLWRNRDVETLEEHEVEDLVLAVKKQGRPAAANALLGLLKTVFRWGVKKRIITCDPTANLEKPTKQKQRSRVLTPDEIRVTWQAFSEIPKRHGAVLRFLILTGQRRVEVAELPWCEIEGEWWRLAETRTKNRKPNLLYVTPLAQRILDEVRPETENSRYVFRGYLRADQPLSTNQVTVLCGRTSAALLRDRKIASAFTTHDLRRTFATTARSIGADRRVVKRILNHSSSDVTDIYDLYGMKPEIQAAMTTWDAYLTDLLGL